MFFEQRGTPVFRLAGVQVSVTLWYAILMGFIIVLWPALGGISVAAGVLIAAGVTVSLLVHDFGHALVAKRYKLGPSIVLQAFGGFCFTEREARTDADELRMVVAGPLVGLGLAAIMGALYVFAPGVVRISPVVETFAITVIWFSLVWSAINLLLPIWPLDGGRIFHLLVRRFKPEDVARRWTLNASIFTTIPVGILGFIEFRSFLVALFAIYVIMDNAQALKSGQPLVRRKGTRAKAKASSFHEELLEDAEQAMESEDWREAARLGHHMRAVGSMPAKMLEEVWMILGIATMNMGEYEEALRYLKRAPKKSKVKQAIERCEDELQQR